MLATPGIEGCTVRIVARGIELRDFARAAILRGLTRASGDDDDFIVLALLQCW